MFQTTNQCMYIYIYMLYNINILIYMYHNGMIHICIMEYPYQCVYTGVYIYIHIHIHIAKLSQQSSYQIRPSIGSTKKRQLGNLLDFVWVPSDRSYLLNPQTRIIWVCVSINHQDHHGIWGKHVIQTIRVMAICVWRWLTPQITRL